MSERALHRKLPPRTFLNVNVPRRTPLGIRVTVQGARNHATTVTDRHDPRGRPYYWIGEGKDEWLANADSDRETVQAGFVSVTPLQTDLTAVEMVGALKALGFESGPEVE
jgi:5'-nucleotidase